MNVNQTLMKAEVFFRFFASGYVLKFVQAQIHFFCGLTLAFFFSSVQLKRKAYSTIDQQNSKGHEKRNCLLFSKVDFSIQISQRKKFYLLIQFSQIGSILLKKFNHKLF